jgi:hypothetical protein
MPNWCENSITVYPYKGDKVSFERFKSSLASYQDESGGTGYVFCFNQTVPLPEEEEENWYDWCCANWGTKWDVQDADIHVEEDCLTVVCDTAWDAPTEWAKTAARKFDVKITIDYEEPNERFGGHAVATPEGLEHECWDLVYENEDHMETSDDEENVFVYNFDGNGHSAAAA